LIILTLFERILEWLAGKKTAELKRQWPKRVKRKPRSRISILVFSPPS